MRKGLILLLVLAVIGAVAAIAYSKYNEKTPTAADRGTDVSVDAKALFAAYSTDEVAAGKLYNDKVVEVSGDVREVSSTPGGPVNVTLESGDAMGGVVCEFPAGSAQELKKGAQVKVKGICAGFNMDVQLQRCAVVE